EARLTRVEHGARKREGAVGDAEAREHSARQREAGCRVDDGAPVEPAEPVDEVWQRGAERERADDRPEREPAATAEPGRHQLQRGRIDAGEEEAGCEPERDAESGAAGSAEECVRARGAE